MRKQSWKSILLLNSLVSLAGCSSVNDYRGMVAVSLYSADHVFVSQPSQYVKRGSNASFVLSIDVGYSLVNTSYTDYSLTLSGDNSYVLLLPKVTAPTKVSLDIEKNDSTITYHANGGVVKAGGDFFSENYNLTNHKRANTSHGVDELTRDGYSLYGWNTKADLSGEAIGLGSRVSLPDDGMLDLYAVWKEWNPATDFTFVILNGNVTITSYLGSEEEIVVPETIDGKKVTTIAKDAFVSAKANTIYLPYTMETVAKDAFQDCTFSTLYFSDQLTDIADDSFINCSDLKTIHINAYRPPVYVTNNRHSYYADKVDLLILSLKEDKPRMVFEGDSGIWFNLNGETIRSSFDEDYTVINLGLNGFFNAQVQTAALLHYLRKDDVYVHVPAPNSYYQMLIKNDMTENMYTSLELNYDLFSYVDVSTMNSVFDTYASYVSVKATMESESYEDICPTQWIDESGCIPLYLPSVNTDEDLGDDAYIQASIFTDNDLSRLKKLYADVHDVTGKNVLFGFGATNYDGLSEEDRSESNLTLFEKTAKETFTENVTFVDHMKDNVLRGHNFYNTDFHLNTDAGKEYTTRLAEAIKEALK